MISKITQIQGAGTYDSQYGMLYKFEYTFEDGQSMTANHKTQDCPYKVGDEVEYIVKGSNAHGSYGQVKRPDDNSGHTYKAKSNDQKENIARSVALKAAVDIHQGETTEADRILSTADTFLAWLTK